MTQGGEQIVEVGAGLCRSQSVLLEEVLEVVGHEWKHKDVVATSLAEGQKQWDHMRAGCFSEDSGFTDGIVGSGHLGGRGEFESYKLVVGPGGFVDC